MAYFFLSLMASIALALGADETSKKCKKPIRPWLQVATLFFISSLLLSLGLLIYIRRNIRRLEQEERVLINRLAFKFELIRSKMVYVLLYLVEIGHTTLTIAGACIQFSGRKQFEECLFDLTLTSNIMLILIIMGFSYFTRFLALVFGFHFGIPFLRYLKRKFQCLRRHEVSFTKKFPVYKYSEYE